MLRVAARERVIHGLLVWAPVAKFDANDCILLVVLTMLIALLMGKLSIYTWAQFVGSPMRKKLNTRIQDELLRPVRNPPMGRSHNIAHETGNWKNGTVTTGCFMFQTHICIASIFLEYICGVFQTLDRVGTLTMG